jgi:hypothetical protein
VQVVVCVVGVWQHILTVICVYAAPGAAAVQQLDNKVTDIDDARCKLEECEASHGSFIHPPPIFSLFVACCLSY